MTACLTMSSLRELKTIIDTFVHTPNSALVPLALRARHNFFTLISLVQFIVYCTPNCPITSTNLVYKEWKEVFYLLFCSFLTHSLHMIWYQDNVSEDIADQGRRQPYLII